MTRSTLDNFETALLDELRAHVVSQASHRPVRKPIGRRLAALAAAASVVGAVTVGVGLRPDAAFAVERAADGDVMISVMELSDSDGLERALAQEGITADVKYDVSAASSPDLDSEGPSACWPSAGDVLVEPADNGGVIITLNRDYVAAHHSVLHLTVSGGRSDKDFLAASVTWC